MIFLEYPGGPNSSQGSLFVKEGGKRVREREEVKTEARSEIQKEI